jgi:hypothetical protein
VAEAEDLIASGWLFDYGNVVTQDLTPSRVALRLLSKLNSYSSAASVMLQRRGKRGGLAQAVLHGLWAFIRTYLLRAGFLDGREGFMLAVMNAENSYYRYIKLWLKQKS